MQQRIERMRKLKRKYEISLDRRKIEGFGDGLITLWENTNKAYR